LNIEKLNIVKTLNGKEFLQEKGQSILSSAENNNIFFPYSCRTGRCSSCKCKLLSGETTLESSELGLSEKEKKEGWILSCVRHASTNIVIDIEDFADIKLPKANVYPCKISEINNLTHDVLQVYLRFPPNIDFKFLSGQYVDIIGPGNIKRSYSIANNFENNLIELHIKNVPDGLLSNYWFSSAQKDDLLRMNGPKGTFFLRKKLPKKIIFLATGTGIAPVLSMIQKLKNDKVDIEKCVSIFWGARCHKDLYINKCSQLYECDFIPVLSNPHSKWKGDKGYVQDALINKNYDLDDAIVYACGSDAMIRSAEQLLCSNGLPSDKFLSDAFLPSSPAKLDI
jgi:CDP-4-dehydro-6-deoxyglucose reductase